MQLDRNDILNALIEGLRDDPDITALWLEGADATGTADAYSDLDVWLDVLDGYEDFAIFAVRRILMGLGKLDLEVDGRNPDPKIQQAFFHIKDTSPYLIIDLCVQSHSRNFRFTRGAKDEQIKVIFDKAKTIRYRKLDLEFRQDEIEDRVDFLKSMQPIYRLWVEKELARGNFLEALRAYHLFILDPLVELLRIQNEPDKRSFGLKHIYHDLPESVASQLEDLYKVSSIEDITNRLEEAVRLLQQATPLGSNPD